MDFYGTLAGADTYHGARGNTSWVTASNDSKEEALIRATEYIDGHYRSAFMGHPSGGRSQVREWPREDFFVLEKNQWIELPSDEIPREIEKATYEAALRELTPGFLTPDVIPGKNKKAVSVDGAVSVEYWSDEQYPVVKKIDQILAPLIASGGYRENPLSGKATIA